MKYCKWCGEPLDVDDYKAKYHKGRCAGAASLFKSKLTQCYGAKYSRENFSTHERLYYWFFKKLYEAPRHKPMVLNLSVMEWGYMIDMVVAAEEHDMPFMTSGAPRLRELIEIAKTILEMPCTAIYGELPKKTRGAIKTYVGASINYWHKNPQETIRRR